MDKVAHRILLGLGFVPTDEKTTVDSDNNYTLTLNAFLSIDCEVTTPTLTSDRFVFGFLLKDKSCMISFTNKVVHKIGRDYNLSEQISFAMCNLLDYYTRGLLKQCEK